MLIGIASKSHPISLAMAYSYIIIEKMKNPFLSNDNIFEKLPKKSPAGRRDRTPPKLHDGQPGQDRISFGNPALARKKEQPIQTTGVSVSSPRYESEAYRATEKYRQEGMREQMRDGRSEEQFGGIQRRRRETKCDEIISVNRYFSVVGANTSEYAGNPGRGASGHANDIRTQIKMELDNPYKPEIRQSAEPSNLLSNPQYTTLRSPNYQIKQIATSNKDMPFLDKPNPFLKPTIIPQSSTRPRLSKHTSDKAGLIQPRQKSITTPTPKNYNPQSLTSSLPNDYAQKPYMSQNIQNIYPSSPKHPPMNIQIAASPSQQIDISPTSSPKYREGHSSQDTLQKLNDIFNHNMTSSQKNEEFRGSGQMREKSPPNFPISPLASSRDDQIDARLFEEYIQKCMLNSQGREELRNLVGIQIPEPSPKEQMGHHFDHLETVQSMQAPLASPQAPSYRDVRTQQSMRQPQPIKQPYFERQYSVSNPTAGPTPKQKAEQIRQQYHFPKEVIPEQKHIASRIVNQPVPSFPNKQINQSDHIVFDESVPEIKLYSPPVLTEKSNLKGDIHRLPDFAAGLPQKQDELQIRLNVNCDLNSRIQNKLKKVYENNKQRVFLTANQKLTMRRYQLKQD